MSVCVGPFPSEGCQQSWWSTTLGVVIVNTCSTSRASVLSSLAFSRYHVPFNATRPTRACHHPMQAPNPPTPGPLTGQRPPFSLSSLRLDSMASHIHRKWPELCFLFLPTHLPGKTHSLPTPQRTHQPGNVAAVLGTHFCDVVSLCVYDQKSQARPQGYLIPLLRLPINMLSN